MSLATRDKPSVRQCQERLLMLLEIESIIRSVAIPMVLVSKGAMGQRSSHVGRGNGPSTARHRGRERALVAPTLDRDGKRDFTKVQLDAIEANVPSCAGIGAGQQYRPKEIPSFLRCSLMSIGQDAWCRHYASATVEI